MIRIVLVEDHGVVRQGLRLILERQPDFRLVAEAGDGLQAVEMVAQHQPDILLLDLMVPRLHGLEVTRQTRRISPETKVLILSMHQNKQYVVEALRNGAAGYMLKEGTTEELIRAIREVRAGNRYLSPALAGRAIADYIQSPEQTDSDPYATLTNRERLVLQLAAEGLSSTEIATKLFISPRTAETHRANFMRKLSLRSQTDLVRFAIRKSIISA